MILKYQQMRALAPPGFQERWKQVREHNIVRGQVLALRHK
jgi:hypothetical protein